MKTNANPANHVHEKNEVSYIHSKIQQPSCKDEGLSQEIKDTNKKSDFLSFLKRQEMTDREISGCSGFVYGFDKIVLTIPLIDPKTKHPNLDLECIQKNLSCFYTNTYKVQKYNPISIEDYHEDQSDSNDNFNEYYECEGYIEFEDKYKIFNGYLKDIPVKIGHDTKDLIIQFTPSRLLNGHNAAPVNLDRIYNACDIISDVLMVDINSFYVKSIEYALGIGTNLSIESILGMLGEPTNSKNSKRYPMKHGVRWTRMHNSTTIQVYSTNLKNLEDVSRNYGERCLDFENPANPNFDSIRIEMRKYFNNQELTLKDLLSPKLHKKYLTLFRKNICSIHKNVSNQLPGILNNIDLKLLVRSFKNPLSMLKFATSIGIAIIYDTVQTELVHMKGIRKNAFKSTLVKYLGYFTTHISAFTIKEHFHDIILNVLDHYIEYYTLELNEDG